MKPPADEADRLAAIAQAHAVVLNARAVLETAEQGLDTAIRNARRGRPVTWEKIGAVLGITHQGVTDRLRRRKAQAQRAS